MGTDCPQIKILVGDCDLGRGIFAARDLEQGEFILRFTGLRIGLDEALAKGPLHGNVLQIDDALYVDLEPPGVYVNHSCEPNAGIANDVELLALHPIKSGEEIRCDYSTTMADGTWELECRCRAPSCRGTVRDFSHLPASLRERYLASGIVQRFIARECRTR